MRYVRPAFEDLLKRLQTDYIDLGMIHYVDSEEEWEQIQHSDYLDYVMNDAAVFELHHIVQIVCVLNLLPFLLGIHIMVHS